jgi:type IV secretory pathway VirB2 component (pilin)
MRKIVLFLFLLTLFASVVSPATVGATEADSLNTTVTMEQLICNVLGFLTGGVGRALAAFACIGISLAFLSGKVAWTLILTFSLGMACIFGAPTIIKAFTGGNEAACSDVSGGGS